MSQMPPTSILVKLLQFFTTLILHNSGKEIRDETFLLESNYCFPKLLLHNEVVTSLYEDQWNQWMNNNWKLFWLSIAQQFR